MTVFKAITAADAMSSNQYTTSQKIEWLKQCDVSIFKLILDNYEGYTEPNFASYTESTELLVPEPFDTIYIHWLAAQYELANEELARYNTDITLYNNIYQEFRNYISRTAINKKNTQIKYF